MEWMKEEVPGTTYGLSDNGWIDMEHFKQWFDRHFFRHAGASLPLLLLLLHHLIQLPSLYKITALNTMFVFDQINTSRTIDWCLFRGVARIPIQGLSYIKQCSGAQPPAVE